MQKFIFLLSILLVFIKAVWSQEVTDDPTSICPILVGETLPEGFIQDSSKSDVSIHEIIKQQPTVIIYYRGGWCPYCNKQLAQLNEIESQIIKLGFQIIAISADQPEKMQETIDKKELNYQLYSDATMKYARKLGIAFKVDAKTLKKYDRFGIDLEEASGESHFQLPAPAVFITDKKGLIHFSYINPNYKVRLQASVLLAILEKMKI